MSKKRLLLSCAIWGIILVVLVVLYVVPLLKKQPEANPEIYPAFRKIENYAHNYILGDTVTPQEYERCKKAVDLHKQAINSDFYSAGEYYENLKRLGFELPPFYKKNLK